MGNPVFRFQLSHSSLGTIDISPPIGWKQAKLKLERHPEFYSLVEYFDGDFIFYGDNGIDNGGIAFIKQAERLYGVDATINIIISISFDDGEEFESIFSGQLDLSGLQELKNNKIQVPIIRNDFWAKFISRKETPVDLQSATDLDGNIATVIDPVTIRMSPQKIISKYSGYLGVVGDFFGMDIGEFGQIDWDVDLLREIETKFDYNNSIHSSDLLELFNADYAGVYNFDLLLCGSFLAIPASPPFDDQVYLVGSASEELITDVYIQKNTETPIQLNSTFVDEYGDAFLRGSYFRFDVNQTFTLAKGDKVFIYVTTTVNNSKFILIGRDTTAFNQYITNTYATPAGRTYFNPIISGGQENYAIVTANTVYPASEVDGFLLHDAAAIITNRIIGRGLTFYSEFLGSTQTNARTYVFDGCGWKFVLIQGLQIRTYLLTDKRFSMSFDKWWKGANPILNLGLGIDIINGAETIRVEEKSHWFDSSTTSVNINNVYEIIREYDNDKIFKKIEVGYNKWQSEDVSGIDDPQTKHTYATRFQKVGDTLTLYSDFIAASLAIEVTRRQTIEKSKDYKYDNDVFIVAINGDNVSPDIYSPELDENFDSVTNLLNSDTRYNLTLTPLRNMLRWMNFIVGGLQKYLTSSIKFVSGEGNYDMTSDYHCTGNACASVLGVICDNISEKDDIVLDAGYGGLPTGFFDFLLIPQTLKIEIDLPWDDYVRIRSNPKKAIGLSQTDNGHKKFFIKLLEYEVVNAKATMTLWPAEDFDIVVPEFTAPSQECIPPEIIEDCENAITDEFGEELVDENGDCIIA